MCALFLLLLLSVSFSLPLFSSSLPASFFLALVLPSSSSLASSSQSQAEALSLSFSCEWIWSCIYFGTGFREEGGICLLLLVIFFRQEETVKEEATRSLSPEELFDTERRRRDKTPLILSRQQFLACVVICSWRLLPTVSLHPCYCCWSSCLLLTLWEYFFINFFILLPGDSSFTPPRTTSSSSVSFHWHWRAVCFATKSCNSRFWKYTTFWFILQIPRRRLEFNARDFFCDFCLFWVPCLEKNSKVFKNFHSLSVLLVK